LAITAAEDPADKTYAGRLKAGAILEKLFKQEPSHPGVAHYIIHTYDVPALAGLALVAARRYSEIAPDAPHALHMPSHIFTRTGYWQESIDSNVAAIPARYALERQDWKQATGLALRETTFANTDAITWFARGLGAARLGQAAAANESATALQQIHERLLKDGENYWALQVQIQELAVRAWTALAEGKKEVALQQMRSAAELEDGTEKSAVTPGPLVPARELLGEMLLQMNEPAQALEQFEATLRKEPGRFRALYGAAGAAQLSGNRDASQRYFRELLKVCVHADKPGRLELTEAGSKTALKPIIGK
jgi:tetratricopeptide (TPR) repeat protein